MQGPAQAQKLRDSLVEAKSDIVVKLQIPFVTVILRLYPDLVSLFFMDT